MSEIFYVLHYDFDALSYLVLKRSWLLNYPDGMENSEYSARTNMPSTNVNIQLIGYYLQLWKKKLTPQFILELKL